MIVEAALELATQAHAGTFRKYPVIREDGSPELVPYITHPRAVAQRIGALPDATDVMVAAALLHDVLEDTPTDPATIREACGAAVLALVLELTNPSKAHPERPRVARTTMDREHYITASREARRIKLADRTHNLRTMDRAPTKFQELYLVESLKLLEVLATADATLAAEYRAALRALATRVQEAHREDPDWILRVAAPLGLEGEAGLAAGDSR